MAWRAVGREVPASSASPLIVSIATRSKRGARARTSPDDGMDLEGDRLGRDHVHVARGDAHRDVPARALDRDVAAGRPDDRAAARRRGPRRRPPPSSTSTRASRGTSISIVPETRKPSGKPNSRRPILSPTKPVRSVPTWRTVRTVKRPGSALGRDPGAVGRRDDPDLGSVDALDPDVVGLDRDDDDAARPRCRGRAGPDAGSVVVLSPAISASQRAQLGRRGRRVDLAPGEALEDGAAGCGRVDGGAGGLGRPAGPGVELVRRRVARRRGRGPGGARPRGRARSGS